MNERDLSIQKSATEFEDLIEKWRARGLSLLEIVGLMESIKLDILEQIQQDPYQIHATPPSKLSS